MKGKIWQLEVLNYIIMLWVVAWPISILWAYGHTPNGEADWRWVSVAWGFVFWAYLIITGHRTRRKLLLAEKVSARLRAKEIASHRPAPAAAEDRPPEENRKGRRGKGKTSRSTPLSDLMDEEGYLRSDLLDDGDDDD